MSLIQIALLIFFLFAILKVVGRFRAKQLAAGATTLWVVLWLGAGFVVIEPNSTTTVAHLFGVGRGADLVVYVALSVIFFLLFRLMVRFEKMQHDLTQLTREIALRDEEKKKV